MRRKVSRHSANRGCEVIPDLRAKMLSETSAFLTWALAEERNLPRIGRRRVSGGGFGALLRRPGARQAMDRWWDRTLDLVTEKW